MDHFITSDNNTKQMIKIPKDLPILPLRNTIAYPFAILPLVIGVPRSIELIEDALEGDRLIGLVAMKDPSIPEPQPDQIYSIDVQENASGRRSRGRALQNYKMARNGTLS